MREGGREGVREGVCEGGGLVMFVCVRVVCEGVGGKYPSVACSRVVLRGMQPNGTT